MDGFATRIGRTIGPDMTGFTIRLARNIGTARYEGLKARIGRRRTSNERHTCDSTRDQAGKGNNPDKPERSHLKYQSRPIVAGGSTQ